MGKSDKPVLLKKEIIARNGEVHGEVPLEEASSLIGQALYKPVAVLKGNKDEYMNFIGVDKERNCLVLLDVEDAKDNSEIVHWHRLRPRSLGQLLKKNKNELMEKINQYGSTAVIFVARTGTGGRILRVTY